MARQIGKMLNAREPKIVNGPQILDKYVGESEANIRRLFADAEEEEKRVKTILHLSSFSLTTVTYYRFCFTVGSQQWLAHYYFRRNRCNLQGSWICRRCFRRTRYRGQPAAGKDRWCRATEQHPGHWYDKQERHD